MDVAFGSRESRPKTQRLLNTTVIALWTMVLLIVCVRVARSYPQHDVFVTYVDAGRKWAQSQALYATTRGFVYSPLVAACFAPFSWFPGVMGAIFWRLLNVALFCWAISWWLRTGLHHGIPRTAYWLVFLLLLPLSLGNFNNGQVNPLIIGLLMIAILAAHLKRWTLSAVCIGITAYLKIYPLSVGLLLVLIYPRQLSWRLALVLIGFGALSFILQQPAYVLEQYQRWFSSRAADNRRMNPDIAPRDFAMVLKAVHINLSSHAFMILQVLAGAALAALCVFGRFRRWSDERLLICLFALASCWMLLFGPSTEDATYVMLAPALVLTLVQAFHQTTPSWMRMLLCTSYAVLLLGLMVNSFSRLKKGVYVMSVQPSGTLIFAIAAVIWILLSARWKRRCGAVSAAP
jgi:Glycosyltransferase family 87